MDPLSTYAQASFFAAIYHFFVRKRARMAIFSLQYREQLLQEMFRER